MIKRVTVHCVLSTVSRRHIQVSIECMLKCRETVRVLDSCGRSFKFCITDGKNNL